MQSMWSSDYIRPENIAVHHAVAVLLLLAIACLVWRTLQQRWNAKVEGEPVFPVILGIATGNPRFKVSREVAFRHAANSVGRQSLVAQYLERIYNNSRINSRHFCVPDLGYDVDLEDSEEVIAATNGQARGRGVRWAGRMGRGWAASGEVGVPEPPSAFYPPDGSLQVSTVERYERFSECALPLATRVSKQALLQLGIGPSAIGKMVLVTSTGVTTGVVGRGLDSELVRAIGLSDSVEREVVSFQGCGAGINGLRLASQYAVTHPGKLALLVAVELPSLHMHKEDSVNNAILHAIFGDGCAAAVVGGETARSAKPGSLAVLDNRSWLLDGTEDGIQMTLGDNGISCKLSKRLPDYVSANVADFVEEMLGAHNVPQSEVDFWALHPGGHRIVEETRKSLGLSLEETEGCWGVLRDHGNMVSATVLFVLERALAEHRQLREEGGKGFQHVVALSFSPGVTVEGLLLRAWPASPAMPP